MFAVPALIYLFSSLTIVSADIFWTHNTTKGSSHNACCGRNVGTVSWFETNGQGSITSMMDFSFDFPPKDQPMNPVIEAWWCRDFSNCNSAQSIYRAFLSKLSEYEVTSNGTLGSLVKSYDLTTASYDTWKITHGFDDISKSNLVYLNLTTVDKIFNLYAVYSPNATDLDKKIYLPKNSQMLSPKMVKFGIRVQDWKFSDKTSVLVLEAAFGSKGTAATYRMVDGEIQMVVEAIYGEKVNFTMSWEKFVQYDDEKTATRPVTIHGVSDQVYSNVKFQLGDGKFSVMDWDPSIGLSVQTNDDSTTIATATKTVTPATNRTTSTPTLKGSAPCFHRHFELIFTFSVFILFFWSA